MKILKIRVKADSNGKMIYPQGFLNIPCIEHIYCNELETGLCWLVVFILGEDFVKILDKTDVQEISITEAEAFLDKYDPHDTEITDEGMIRAIEIRTKANISLSNNDLKALDPSDPMPGIRYRRRFIDKVKIRLGV